MTDHEEDPNNDGMTPECLFNPDGFCYSDGCPYDLLDFCLSTYERSLNK